MVEPLCLFFALLRLRELKFLLVYSVEGAVILPAKGFDGEF